MFVFFTSSHAGRINWWISGPGHSGGQMWSFLTSPGFREEDIRKGWFKKAATWKVDTPKINDCEFEQPLLYLCNQVTYESKLNQKLIWTLMTTFSISCNYLTFCALNLELYHLYVWQWNWLMFMLGEINLKLRHWKKKAPSSFRITIW